MARILILYGTTEGQTARISEYIAEVAREQGHEADAADIRELSDGSPLEGYETVFVGASIHMGRHEGYVTDFVKKNRELLERVPSAFFSVNLTAGEKTEDARRKTTEYVEEFVEETGWRPRSIGIFAGALLYTQYGFVKRRVMKKISRDMGSKDTDTSRDYEYTDWEEVERFTERSLEGI